MFHSDRRLNISQSAKFIESGSSKQIEAHAVNELKNLKFPKSEELSIYDKAFEWLDANNILHYNITVPKWASKEDIYSEDDSDTSDDDASVNLLLEPKSTATGETQLNGKEDGVITAEKSPELSKVGIKWVIKAKETGGQLSKTQESISIRNECLKLEADLGESQKSNLNW